MQNLSHDFPVLRAWKQISPMRHGEDSSKGKRETENEVDFDSAFRNLKTHHRVCESQSSELLAIKKEELGKT